MPKPRLLFLSQSLPYPPHSGVTNRTFNILRELSRSFDVTLLAFSRRNHQGDAVSRAAARDQLGEVLQSVGTPSVIRGEWSRLSRVMTHASSLLSGRPYTYFEYSSHSFQRALDEALRHHQPFAAVHMDSLDLFRWLVDLPALPTFCTHHSIESELLRLRGNVIRPRLLRWYMLHQAKLIERVERELAPTLTLNIMMSQLDATRLQELAPGSRTAVVPNGVDTEFFRPANNGQARGNRIVFVGPSYMFPNRDAIEFFLAEVWPLIRRQNSTVTFEIIGRASDGDAKRFRAHPGVVVHGYVDDLRPLVISAACCLAPLRVGGGTRLKILDAWAMGQPVVSTSIGCEGLDAQDGGNILIRDDPAGFAEAVLRLLAEPHLGDLIGQSARKTVEAQYSWRAIGASMCAEYQAHLPK